MAPVVSPKVSSAFQPRFNLLEFLILDMDFDYRYYNIIFIMAEMSRFRTALKNKNNLPLRPTNSAIPPGNFKMLSRLNKLDLCGCFFD